jgi:hypothetical protein
MAITQKFAYAAQLAHYKEAIKSDSDKFKDSIVFTGDGYIVSRGTVIKGTVLTNKEVSGDYGLHFNSSDRTVTFKDENGNAASKTIELPNAEGDGVVVLSYSDGKYVASHKTQVDKDPTAITGNSSISSIVSVGSLEWDKYGHVKSASKITFDAAQVKQNKFAANTGNLVISGNSTDASDTTGHLNKTKVVITNETTDNTSSISGVKNITATGEIKATTLYEGSSKLSDIYVKSITYASGTN